MGRNRANGASSGRLDTPRPACEFRHDIVSTAAYLGRMSTSTLRHLSWLEDVAPVTGLGELPDVDVDARFWAAIDLMDGLLYDS